MTDVLIEGVSDEVATALDAGSPAWHVTQPVHPPSPCPGVGSRPPRSALLTLPGSPPASPASPTLTPHHGDWWLFPAVGPAGHSLHPLMARLSGLDLSVRIARSVLARMRRYGPAGAGTHVTSPRAVAVQLRMS
jgi:hypothetical protein